MTRKKWTKEEDDRLIKAVSENSGNIQQVFRMLAEELGRTRGAVEIRWYGVLNNPNHPKYRGTACFITISRKKRLINNKIESSKRVSIPHRVSLWNRILKLIGCRK